VRDLRRSVAPLSTPATPLEWASRLRAFVDRSGARRRAARGAPAIARRDLAAIARLEEVLDELAAALAAAGGAGEKISREQFASFFDLAVGLADLPAGQGPAAGGVEAWPTEEAPGVAVRAAIVLGAERGGWPEPQRVDAVLGNGAREPLDVHLGRRGLSTAFHRRSEAEFRGWSALAAGSEVLAVAWTEGPDREGPAPLAALALDLAGAEELRLGVDPPLEASRGVAEALRAAARLAAAGQGALAGEALAGLPDLASRAGAAAARGGMERERRDAWVAGRAAPTAGRIPPALPAFAGALPAEWSATDLETFAACPYRFLLRAAGVREPDQADLDMEPRDEGAMLHAILEAFVRARRDRGAWPLAGDAADLEEARLAAAEVLARFEAEGRVGDPSTWAGRREAVLLRLDRFVAAEAAAQAHEGLRPVLLEFAFGGRSGRSPIAIPAVGGDVLVQGRIDRVDADDERLLVLDYKNSRSSEAARERLSEEERGTSSFQAPIYLLAAARELPGRSELSATYSLLRSGERVAPWTVAAGDPFLELDLERRAEIRAGGGRNLADGVVAAVNQIRSGELPVAPRDCTGCPYGAVCRFPRAGEA
jgi:RecB family exonuclease